MFLLVFITHFIFQNGNSFDQKSIRDQYHEAIYDAGVAKELDQKLESLKQKSTLQIAYFGANKMLLAKHASFPNTKYKLFTEGRSILENAIREDSKNIEMIYLRYSIQLNAPALLNYNGNKTSDRDFLLKNYALVQDKDLKNRILIFLLAQAQLSSGEKAMLK